MDTNPFDASRVRLPTDQSTELRGDTEQVDATRTEQRPEVYRVSRISGFLEKPTKYTGSGPERFIEFTTWSRRLRSYLSTVNAHYPKLMDCAEKATEPIGEEGYIPTDTLTTTDLRYLANDLRMTLESYTTGTAAAVIESWLETTDNGFELWRLLCKKYRQTTLELSRSLLQQVHNFEFDTTNFEDSLTKWESQISRYERTTGKTMDEQALLSKLYGATTGALKDFLTLHISEYNTYQKVRDKILDWHRLQAMNSRTSGNTTGVNAVYNYGVGSGKGKQGYPSQYWGNYYPAPRKGYPQKGKGYSSKAYKGKGKGRSGKGYNHYHYGSNNWIPYNRFSYPQKGKSKYGYPKGKGKGYKGKKGKGKNYNKGKPAIARQNNTTGGAPTPMEIGAVYDNYDWNEEELYWDESLYDYGEDSGSYDDWTTPYVGEQYDNIAHIGAIATDDTGDHWDDDWYYYDESNDYD